MCAIDCTHASTIRQERFRVSRGIAPWRASRARRTRYRLVAFIIASALFMENLDATVLATAIPTMARDFHVRAPEMSVALTAYLLALALFIPASRSRRRPLGCKERIQDCHRSLHGRIALLRDVAESCGHRHCALRAGNGRGDDAPVAGWYSFAPFRSGTCSTPPHGC